MTMQLGPGTSLLVLIGVAIVFFGAGAFIFGGVVTRQLKKLYWKAREAEGYPPNRDVWEVFEGYLAGKSAPKNEESTK